MSRKQWRCYHCDFVTTSPKYAQQHFGISEMDNPACKIAGSESGLVGYLRRLEAELTDYRAESHETLVAAYAIQAEARGLAAAAEQRGYDKGVSDGIDYARNEEKVPA